MNNNQNIQEDEIDLLALFFHFLRHWKLLLLGIIVGGLVAGGYTYIQTPTYQSETMIYILSKTTSITSYADLQIGSAISADFSIITKSKPVIDTAIEQVKEELNVSLEREDVLDMLTVENEDNSRVLVIKVVSEDPKVACSLANAITEATTQQMADIMQSDPPTTVERAEVADKAVPKGLKKKGAMGAAAGLVIMLILTAIPFLTYDKIDNVEDVETYLGEVVIGVIPLDKAQVYEGDKKKKKKKSKR